MTFGSKYITNVFVWILFITFAFLCGIWMFQQQSYISKTSLTTTNAGQRFNPQQSKISEPSCPSQYKGGESSGTSQPQGGESSGTSQSKGGESSGPSKPKGSGPTLVLLLTYMRSGSSLTGDILQQSPGAFYVYEPLRSVISLLNANVSLEYYDGTVLKLPNDIEGVVVDVLRHWFGCRLTLLPKIALRDISFLGRGILSRRLGECLKNQSIFDFDEQLSMGYCMNDLEHICEDAPVRIIKTIRVGMQVIHTLLEELPNLKIVHLVRDPRATLLSQAELGRCSEQFGGISGCTSLYCDKMIRDIKVKNALMQKFPNRIYTVFYEDIARTPIETAKQLYKLCGLDFTAMAEEYIYNITMAGNPDNCSICTVRANSSEHVDAWKTNMYKEFIDIVEDKCKTVLNHYKYPLYNH